MRNEVMDSIGRVEVKTVPLPEEMEIISGTYTWSGKVLVAYRSGSEPDNWINLATLNDDGSKFTLIFSGVLESKPTANGLRWMVFKDNRRILTGDHIIECTPDIDHCESVSIKPVVYPDWLMKARGLWLHWSEVIISPDNLHICWTTLGGKAEGVYIGTLRRETDSYHIDEVKSISSRQKPEDDPDHKGCVIPPPIRGGEVKQFVRGGRAISSVGAGFGVCGPVIQELDGNDVIPFCRTPGYDETLILSPDEQLGIVMSTRFSPATDFGILGLLPLPYGQMIMGRLAMPVYCYAVSDVRSFRQGNIGPVLISMDDEQSDPKYTGVDLHDQNEEFIYYSPMSWHPDSNRAMWNERERLSGGASPARSRLRIAVLADRSPASAVRDVSVPSEIPYAVNGEENVSMSESKRTNMRIAGKDSGFIRLVSEAGKENFLDVVYDNFSDDGKTFWNGTLRIDSPAGYFGRTVFFSLIEVTGENQGHMKLRMTFVQDSVASPVRLLDDTASDGKPASYGEASYNGYVRSVVDMVNTYERK